MQIQDITGCLLLEVQPTAGRLYLGGALLRRAQLQNADLRGAILSCADLRQANLDGADLSGALLDDADLTDASLVGARFDGTTLLRTKFTGANLTAANLSAAIVRDDRGSGDPILTNANLEKADLTGVRLSGDFQDVKFWFANLAGCRLSGSFTRTKFNFAVLDGASLSGDFTDADFSGTDLSKRVTIVVRRNRGFSWRPRWDQATKWPPGFDGYLLAFSLMTWDEIHLGPVTLVAVLLPLALALRGVLVSPFLIVLAMACLWLTGIAWRVHAVWRRKI